VKDMPNPGPGEANVIPIGPWIRATKAVVEKGKAGGGEPDRLYDVDIYYFIWTPGGRTYDDQEFENGVVILNESDRPSNSNPITTVSNSDFNRIDAPSGTKYVYIIKNVGWPCGVVLLW
jgi:hypothetical protein